MKLYRDSIRLGDLIEESKTAYYDVCTGTLLAYIYEIKQLLNTLLFMNCRVNIIKSR